MRFPLCPQCNGGAVQLIASREGSSYFDPESNQLLHQTIYTLECGHGHRFAYSVRRTELWETAAASLDELGAVSLPAEAHRQ